MDETRVLKLELDVASINIILAGLGKLPLEVCIKVFNNIQQQAQDQLSNTSDSVKSSKSTKIKAVTP